MKQSLNKLEKVKKVTEKRRTGDIGEEIASRFLMKHGYQVIERNFLRKCGEIDIITKKEGTYCFFEIKSVSCKTLHMEHHKGAESIRPEENLHSRKLGRLFRTIKFYLAENKIDPETEYKVGAIIVKIDRTHRKASVKIIDQL